MFFFFLFRSDKNSDKNLAAMATFSFHRFNGKNEHLLFLQSHWRYLNFAFAEMFI